MTLPFFPFARIIQKNLEPVLGKNHGKPVPHDSGPDDRDIFDLPEPHIFLPPQKNPFLSWPP
jgi:hypothetical protein